MYAPLYLNSSSRKPPLRIGLLLDTKMLPACFAEALGQIARSNFARLELVVFNGDAQLQSLHSPPPRSMVRRTLAILAERKRRRKLLFALYQRWDAKHISEAQDPLREVDCGEYLKGIESLTVTPVAKRFVHRFPEDAVRRLREKNLDVLIRFGFNILRGDILQAARYGVWSYHHGDNNEYRGGPAYFWELYEDNPLSGAVLQVLTEELDAGKVLHKGIFATCRGVSWARNRVQPYWGSTTFLIQKLRQLHDCGWERVDAEALPPEPYRGKTKIYTAPTNGQMLRWFARQLIRTFVRRTLRLVRGRRLPHWRLALNWGSQSCIAGDGKTDLTRFQWIESPPGHFYADPFLIEHSGKPWVFFEDFDYRAQKGVIACAEVTGKGISKVIPALEKPYHLSYPCVFWDEAGLYLVPESNSNKTVELYRCTRFPDAWETVATLMQIPAVDTTVWVEDGLYWFFVTLKEARGAAFQLCLFYSRTLTGEWTSHPQNPIATDVRFSRGAGAIFKEQGKLFRPSQDCSGNYGRRCTLNEIVVLNEREYRERPRIAVVAEGIPGILGTHTYSRLAQLEVIDGYTLASVRRLLR